MRKITTQICLAFCLLCCNKNRSKVVDKIFIEGNVKNIPDGKVYLADAHQWEILLDSAECINGRFHFQLIADSSFVPMKVAIQYKDSAVTNEERYAMFNGYKRPLFHNHTRGADSLKYYIDSFILEKGTTKIVGDAKAKAKLRVFAGKETDVLYSLQMQDFGWLGNLEGEKRLARIRFFKNKIKENPYSYYLLQETYSAKEQYSEQELREMLGLFNQDVQASAFGRKVNQYLADRADPDQPYPNFSLAGPNNQRCWMMDNGAKVNMFVFWASWCGPCRREIPQLKELYTEYKGRGLNLVSISIDEKPENWHKALGQEQMKWQQLIVEKNQIDLFKHKFNFAAIPLVILTDSRGKEIKRFIGYEENNERLYRDLLEERLGKK